MLRIPSVLVALLFCTPALAQTHADAMARLAAFEGTYTLSGTAQIEEGTYTGTLTVEPTLGGHFQEWTWEMTGVDTPSPTHLGFITTYDTASGEYHIWRFDSRDIPEERNGVGNEVAGTIHFDGDTLVMAWPTINPDDPTMRGSFRNAIQVTSAGLDVDTYVLPEGQPRVAIATTRASRR